MKINTTLFLSKILLSLLLVAATLFVISCGNDDSYYIKPPKEEGSIYSLELANAKGSVNYINLKNRNLVDNTAHWDFSMSGTYASNINANTNNHGAINYIDKAYDDVTTDEVLKAFKATKENFLEKFSNISDFGIHKNPLNGNQEGWVEYNGVTHKVTSMPNRTILLVTTNPETNMKKLYKLKISSLYQNADPATNKAPFLSCDFKELESPF
ncbi:MAG: hypothetical protein ACQPRH_02560 [Solitalea-like symbiont of Tyrophagus putrescentiae]